jgi:hypothetical protein
MADDSSTDLQNNPALLSQLLALLGQANGGSTPGTLQPAAPNTLTNNQNQTFQLGAGGLPTPENPGSSPTSSAWDATTGGQFWNGRPVSYNASGAYIPPPLNNNSVGGSQYGNASGSDGQTGFVNTPSQYQQYQNALNGAQTQLQGSQLNQLLGGLLKQYQSQQTPAVASAAPPPPPVAPPVANNQMPYTPPSQAQAPGMNLASQLQNGMTQQAIMAQGGPKTASTDTSNLQIPSQYIPNQATTVGTQGLVNQSGQAAGGLGSALTGAANIPVQAMQAYQKAQTLQNNGFGPAARSYSPTPINWDPNAQLDGSSYSPTPAGVSGYIGNASGSAADNGGMDGTSGFIGTGAGDDASAGAGAGAAAGMGAGIAGGISAIGQAIASAYKPIALRPIPQVQMPQSPTFSSPAMIG